MSLVRFLDFRRLYSHYDVDDVIKRCLVNGKLVLQEDVEEFEENFAKFVGKKHCVALNSGTDALMMGLIAAGVGKGDEVITVSHTFIATIQVIHHLGAKPVLVDVDRETGLMDYSLISEAITDKTKAIIPVHLMGDYVFPSAIDDTDIKVIEDAAQAIGARMVGYGDVQAYSFYPAKILGTFGDAGAVTTNNEHRAARIRSLRNHGGVSKYSQKRYEYGWNSRMDNIWAAVLNEKLRTLEDDIKKRETIAQKYLWNFKDLPIELPPDSPGRVWQDFVIRVPNPVALANMLKQKGIETLGAGARPNHHHPGLGLEGYDLPNTDYWVNRSLRLPCNHLMTDEEVDEVIKAMKEVYGVY